ncbi:unnamed protein product [Adineta steineri]|uniref:Uncharacterized protein n=1 Tax=Adineta steineri TaxID=433720 RepID=A0A814UMV3_9BILA|nr:unnamed protein product [Adineta steineri]CAF1177810.1 unnamed protein product [Adineta steineri]
MLLWLYIIIIWQMNIFSCGQFNIYNTDDRQDGYCLLYYVTDSMVKYYEPYILTHQTISYCIRSTTENNLIREFDFHDTINNKMTFIELRKNNITSEMLLYWSATFDLAERYEIFLDNLLMNTSSENEVLLYNCTPPWFGPFCNVAFDIDSDLPLHTIIMLNVGLKIQVHNNRQVTCYIHLKCDRSLCLDWREICDGKIDCSDGSDEYNCWQLKINECAANEYRCHNGQCISSEFLHDIILNPDCLDRSDEGTGRTHPSPCSRDPAFRCEEHTCRPGGEENFPCGDGQCTARTAICQNGRDSIFLDNLCAHFIACLTYFAHESIDPKSCKKICANGTCIKDNCPDLYQFPSEPALFGHVRLLYQNKEVNTSEFLLPQYVCHNEQLCKDFLPATIYINGISCRYIYEIELRNDRTTYRLQSFLEDIQQLFRGCLTLPNELFYCNRSTMYQCYNSSKYISKHQLVDHIQDCPFNDDETYNESCSLVDIHHRFPCFMNDKAICLAAITILDRKPDCTSGTDELSKEFDETVTHIHFPTICDGRKELRSILSDEQNETDETECQYWPCNNTYSRCNGHRLCRNGADEMNCPSSMCSQFEQSCIYINDTSKVSCLSINRVGNNITDCIGSPDEENQCWKTTQYSASYNFRCWNDTKCVNQNQLCNNVKDCPFGDDEILCENYRYSTSSLCDAIEASNRTDIENYFCNFFKSTILPRQVYFTLKNMPTYSFQQISNTVTKRSLIQSKILPIDTPFIELDWRCNRGLRIKIRLNSTTSKLSCLCSLSYYGDKCQYQNERVSLTLAIRMTSDWQNLLIFIITLIDNDGIIQSYDYIEYLSVRDCNIKFNIYLLYLNQTKNLSKNYAVQINAFNKLTLNYRATWIFPIQFLFLPVYRLAILLTVPFNDIQPNEKCSLPCLHGKCYHYINNKNLTFCRCKPGWSVIECNIKYTCTCALNSLCFAHNICVCPIDQYGKRCYFKQSICHSNICMNDGRCISSDKRYISERVKTQICICKQGYFGEFCEQEQIQNRIEITFHHSLIIPTSLFIHFITINNNTEHTRMSIMKKISFDQNSLIFSTSNIFNIVFAEMFKNYYLIILQEQTITSANILTEINPLYRCLSLDELFNKTFINQHLLKRIKYYHIPCQEQINLICFYDSNHICLCDLARQTNCFEFDHNVTYDCRGYNLCENDGKCFQDKQTCPTSAFCSCPECYYGSRCQFSTQQLILSLDFILGYRIHQHVNINQQPIIVKFAIILATIILFTGIINNVFSYLTFIKGETRNVGCGIYLFVTSIISLIIITIFIIKLTILVLSQMHLLNNRLFIHIQCVITDFLLRSLLSISDWLSACVAIERAVTILKGANFNKNQSKRIAKQVILFVCILTFLTYIHDPIHRHLIDDEEEQRTWCVIKYPSSLQIYDWILNVFHFSIPPLINCISALIIIIYATRTRSKAQKKLLYRQILREQFQHHKHLLISPCILIILALPRLILSCLSGCIKLARDSWLYLIIYFISLIPPMMTFIVFVLPSNMYKKEFTDSVKRFWQ